MAETSEDFACRNSHYYFAPYHNNTLFYYVVIIIGSFNDQSFWSVPSRGETTLLSLERAIFLWPVG
jgi:hypothetical protein